MSVGLGFKVPITEKVENINDALPSQKGSRKDDWSQISGTTRNLQSTLRSASSMRGLLLAEVGDSMVELDICGEGSGFRQGQRIAIDDTVFLGGGPKQDEVDQTTQEAALSRHGTLLSIGANPGRNAAELKSILGDSSARLKSGATVLPESSQSYHGEERTVFEQAKSRARVELDIILDSKTCVQGGYLQGHIKIRIKSPSNKESPVMVSDGKVRVIGFECISNEHDRYPFYHCSALFSDITATSENLFGYPYDAEGFAPAVEGTHTLAFSMHLPMSTEHGVPKGALRSQTGVAVRYIAMASIKLKDSDTGKRSIAHFYRNCEIWPRLNPSVILAPAVRPLRMSTTKRLFMGGTGEVTLTAILHRLHWIAGQQCCVKVDVKNATKKAIKSLTLTLIRCTVVFKPDIRLDASNDNMDPDACQTSTTQKAVAESVLEHGQRGARGHASAKGWWTGVSPGEHMTFFHFIEIPSDALTITRNRLLEVNYSLRVTLSAGTLRTADVQVTLPICIANFLSVDPPPSFPLAAQGNHTEHTEFNHSETTSVPIAGLLQRGSHSRPVVTELFGSHGPNSRPLASLAEADDESPTLPGRRSEADVLQHGDSENPYDDSEIDGEYPVNTDENSRFDHLEPLDLDDETGSYKEDIDGVQHALAIAVVEDLEHAPRFADLYYASLQEDLRRLTRGDPNRESPEGETYEEDSPVSQTSSSLQQSPNLRNRNLEGYPDLLPNARPPIGLSRPNRPRGPSSFVQRVQEKREAQDISESRPVTHTPLSEGDDGYQVMQDRYLKTSTGSNYARASSDFPDLSPRDTPDNQELQNDSSRIYEVRHEASMPAGANSSDGYLPATHELSIPDSAGSSAFTLGSDRTSSRLLPKPPSMTKYLSPGPGHVPTPPSDPAPTPIYKYSPPAPHSLEHTWSGISEDVRIASSTAARPKLRPQPGNGDSTSSVKDKIRELEERVKAAEQV